MVCDVGSVVAGTRYRRGECPSVLFGGRRCGLKAGGLKLGGGPPWPLSWCGVETAWAMGSLGSCGHGADGGGGRVCWAALAVAVGEIVFASGPYKARRCRYLFLGMPWYGSIHAVGGCRGSTTRACSHASFALNTI